LSECTNEKCGNSAGPSERTSRPKGTG